MKYLITGTSGFVGTALRSRLASEGHEAVALVRREPAAAGEARWVPETGEIGGGALEDAGAVVHLAGESIAAGRWSAARKERIRESRVGPTRALAEALARAQPRPSVLVTASAIGYYGVDRGDESLNEESSPGDDFLARLCRDWEAAAEPAREAGIRVVNLRIGMVIGAGGGALARMLTPFKLGLGGRIGSGRQYVSWVLLDDLVGIIIRAADDATLHGAVNAVAPHPVTNAGFTRTLGSVLRRPTILPMPAFAARLAFGEMADALLLASQRVEPARLRAAGFEWSAPDLDTALRRVLEG